MNTRNLPTSVLLVLLGAGATLLIGAFAHFDSASTPHLVSTAQASAVSPAVSNEVPPADGATAFAVPGTPSTGLAEVIKMAKAHVDESVILAYIKNSHQAFSPTAEEILYLSDLGLSQDVIGALVGTTPSPAPPQPAPQLAATPGPMPPPETAPAPPFVSAVPPMGPIPPDGNANAGMFYNDLAPYGTWEQQPDYGLVWQPTVVTINPGWSPYVDGGQWLNSDSGWYWNSDYTWGWAPFHYGRWANVPGRGWVWQPGSNWSPAWVAWRSSSEYAGWAALPPGAGLNVLGQLTYKSQPVGSNATFGLPASAYTFVNIGGLANRNLPRRVLPATRANALFQSTALLSTYSIVNNRIFNGGVSPDAVASARQRAVRQVSLQTVNSQDAAGLGLERGSLTVYVPASFSRGSATGETSASSPSAAVERPARQESATLADNVSPEAEASVRDESQASAAPVQLPPLHYPSTPAPMLARRDLRRIETGPRTIASLARPGWQGGFPVPSVNRPASLPPRLEAYNPPIPPVEMPRPAVEYHPAPAEVPRPALEPVRSAPVQASSSKSTR